VISKSQEAGTVGRALTGKLVPGLARRSGVVTAEIQAAYAACRAIARKKGKKFFITLCRLPAKKRDAICAVYAFMRQATISRMTKICPSEAASRWITGSTLAPGPGWRIHQRPVFIALLDAQRSLAIPSQLLDQLYKAQLLILNHGCRYATFADLYRYCYLVASVRRAGVHSHFRVPRSKAEKLAEETGIAFQLTNILRDVQEMRSVAVSICRLKIWSAAVWTAGSMTGISSGRQLTSQQRRVLPYWPSARTSFTVPEAYCP